MLESLMISADRRDQLDHATAFYAAQMPPQLLAYLAGRGIDAAAAASTSLGCVLEALPGHEQFTNMLVIPYLADGHTLALKFRRPPDDDGPKYMGISGQTPRLYGVDALRTGPSVVAIVEGELDAIVMTHAVGVPAVGVPGASTWLKHHPRCFADVDRVIVVCDNDASNEKNPGQALARKVVKDIRGAQIVTPPDNLDVSDWFMAEGRGPIRKAMGV